MSAKQYFIVAAGYECPQPFGSLKEARAALQEELAASLAAARRRSKEARKHRLGEDNYSITLGCDRCSALWASFCIVEA